MDLSNLLGAIHAEAICTLYPTIRDHLIAALTFAFLWME